MSKQHSMKNRRSVGAEPYAPKKMKAVTGGGKGRTTPVTTACMSRSWKVELCQKNNSLGEMINQQSAPRSTSSTKQQIYLSVTYQHDRLHLTGKRPQQWSQRPQQQQSTPSTHRLYFSKESSQGKKTPNNAIPGRMHATTGFFHGYCLLTTFAWRSLTTGGTCKIQPSRPRRRSHPQCCCVAFSGAVIVITTTSSSFSHACACHVYIHVCMYAYLSNSMNKCTIMIPTAVPWGFFYTDIIICFRTKYYSNLEIMSCQVIFRRPLHPSRSEE